MNVLKTHLFEEKCLLLQCTRTGAEVSDASERTLQTSTVTNNRAPSHARRPARRCVQPGRAASSLSHTEAKPATAPIMKIILNPKYERLRDYLTHLEDHFNNEGHEIHAGRNVIRTLQVDGLTLCVKRYAQPSLRRRVQQLLYKSNKAKLAYVRPMLLRERGFESPESVASVIYRTGLLNVTTYFVCLLSDYRYNMEHALTLDAQEQAEVVTHFARFAAHLHEDGFLHRDFSSTNILYDVVDGRYHFSLIDTNSMKCGHPVSIEAGCRNLAQLTGNEAFFSLLAKAYAAERQADPALCARLINEARH